MNFSRGVGGSLSHLWKFRRGGGAISSLQKWKIRGGGGVLSEIPSVVGVWIFSGTTQCMLCTAKPCALRMCKPQLYGDTL